MLRQARSFCRICAAHCSMVLTIDDDAQRIIAIKGDKESPLSRGYVCFKGLQAEEAHHGPARLLRPLKRQEDGSFTEIESERALDEIADKMQAIVAKGGAQAVAAFKGTAGTLFATHMIQLDFLRALGSSQFFSVNTIDQSAKFVSFGRMGAWAAGTPDIDQSEVLLFFGCNPLISHSTMPVMGPDPKRTLERAKARGMKLICIDPRRTETAQYADVHLQPLPGRDTAIAAAMIRLILDNAWHDTAFTTAHVGPEWLALLRAAVAPFTPEFVASIAEVDTSTLIAAARMFALEARSGSAFASTGPSMAPFSNTMQHLVDTLNVICGRYRRAGQTAVVDMINPPDPIHAEVIPAPRPWEHYPPSRIRGAGMLGFDRLSSTLPDEILTPGEGQIRALLVSGANPATCIPDQDKAVAALRNLELLVVIDPYMSATAKLAHYVLPPTMMYERPDLPIAVPGFNIGTTAWSQYTPAVLPTPAGSDLVDDWYPYWALAKRLGLRLEFAGTELDLTLNRPPTTNEMLELRARHGRITLEELKADRERFPAGRIYDHPSALVQPPRPGASAKFEVMPPDVAAELDEFLASDLAQPHRGNAAHPYLLITRRMNRVMNSTGNKLAGTLRHDPVNPAYLHPDELERMRLLPGDMVEVASEHGRIETVVAADTTLRPGVVSISHCWGGLPGEGPGGNVNQLIPADRHLAPINAMPRMSAVPVNVAKLTK